MQDTSALVAPYSAMIQANATIIAILAGFLLALASLGRTPAERLRRSLEEAVEALQQNTDEMRELNEEFSPEEQRQLFGLKLQGKLTQEDLDNHFEDLHRRGSTLVESEDQLSVSAHERLDRFLERERTSGDYSSGTIVLILLGLFGVVAPLSLLAYLPSDPSPFRCSYFAVAAYACALFSVLVLK